MSSDVYRRSGRGGAGNFFSQEQVDEQIKAAKEDIEAQNQTSIPSADLAAASVPVPGAYARAGRGGAGNFYEPSEKVHQDRIEREAAELIKEVTTKQVHKSGLSGRGGMGNWTEISAQNAVAEDEEQRRAALEAKIKEDVESGLKMPTPAYKGDRSPGQ